MGALYNDVPSKLERALCAYLIGAGAGSVEDVFPFEWEGQRAYPNTTVSSAQGNPDPSFSGNLRIQVHVSIKGSATKNYGEPNPGLARVEFDTRCAQTIDALMQSGNGQDLSSTCTLVNESGRALATPFDGSPVAAQVAANNADMTDFTLIQWIDRGFVRGEANGEGCSWERIYVFEALCCGSNVD